MLDTQNRAKPYRKLAEECRRLATSTPSTQIKNRYLLMAQDYLGLADLKEQAHAHDTPAPLEENAAWPATITGRFPGPWRIDYNRFAPRRLPPRQRDKSISQGASCID
jgi:hypothetical protein